MEKNDVWLCLGGNLGDRLSNLEEARFFVEFNMGDIIQASGIYESPGWQMGDVPFFLNQVLHIQTDLSVEELFVEIRELEEFYGKKKNLNAYVSREMDMDVLFYGTEIIDSQDITIPHPRLELRKFVLVPLNEMAPELVHPVLNKNISELILICDDKSEVIKIS